MESDDPIGERATCRILKTFNVKHIKYLLDPTVKTLSPVQCGSSTPKSGGEGSQLGGLHLHLDRLHWAQSNVGEEFCRCRGSQVQGGLVQICVLLSDHVGVGVLEELVEAELAQALHGVANGSGRPAQEEPPHALLGHGELEAIAQALVLLLVHLQPALHQVERSHLDKNK